MSGYDANYQAQFSQGKAWYTILFDEYGVPFGTVANPIVTSGGGGGATEIEGIIEDDAAVGTTNPVVVGGVYIADPTLNPLEDGDAGWALLNDERMFVVESRSFDPTSGADQVLPMWNPTDLWEPEDHSDSASANGTTTTYVVMEPNSRWSIEFIPTNAATETITLTVSQSNEDTGDETTATYLDVTDTFFGVAGITADGWIEPEHPTACLYLRIQVTITNYASGTPSWEIYVNKRGNS